LLYKFLRKFVEDKGKPIDLCLTVKKKVYEQLKNDSEALINNLLNKIVGNEEIDQETKDVGQNLNITSDDIVITKLNNSINYSSTNSKEFLVIYLKTIVFFLFILIYITIKLIYYGTTLTKLYEISLVVNVTEFSQVNVIEDINFFKSYLYNNSIPIKNETETKNLVVNRITDITQVYEELMLSIYDKLSYLGKTFENYIYNRLNNNITEIAQGGAENIESIYIQMIYGCKQIFVNYCENFRFLWDYYLNGNEIYLNMTYFETMNIILRNVIRPWYADIKSVLYNNLDKYVDKQKLLLLICIICIGILTCVVYVFFWKNLERKLEDQLITSLELLNLLPDELKNQIVTELNKEGEEENS